MEFQVQFWPTFSRSSPLKKIIGKKCKLIKIIYSADLNHSIFLFFFAFIRVHLFDSNVESFYVVLGDSINVFMDSVALVMVSCKQRSLFLLSFSESTNCC